MDQKVKVSENKQLKRYVIMIIIISIIVFFILYRKNEVLGLVFPILALFFIAVFSVIYFKKETAYIKKHGVWTIVSVNEKFSWSSWRLIYYEFQYNNRTYVYSREADINDMKKINIGNRFFMIVVPDDVNRLRKYDAVPEWFTLDAPPEGWKTCPTETELRNMMQPDKQALNK